MVTKTKQKDITTQSCIYKPSSTLKFKKKPQNIDFNPSHNFLLNWQTNKNQFREIKYIWDQFVTWENTCIPEYGVCINIL